MSLNKYNVSIIRIISNINRVIFSDEYSCDQRAATADPASTAANIEQQLKKQDCTAVVNETKKQQ